MRANLPGQPRQSTAAQHHAGNHSPRPVPKVEVTNHNNKGKYTLATGEGAVDRLTLLQRAYGPATIRLLQEAGVERGMNVVDIGCGVGTVTEVLSELVGPEGSVVGVDYSGAQIAQACQRLNSRYNNITFVEASALDTGLARGTFDLVYSRFLLIHLQDPTQALLEMHQLLRPGGILVCEDGDLTNSRSEPATPLNLFSELFGKLGPARGVDYTLGRRLFQMVLAAGFESPQVMLNQPVYARGAEKRVLELSIAEAAAAIVETGLMTAVELEQALVDMRHATEDETVLAILPQMAQVWARKS